MGKPEKAAAILVAFFIFMSGSAGLDIGGQQNFDGDIKYFQETRLTDGETAQALGGMLSCVIGAMLDRQCFLLEGEPDVKLASLSVLYAVYRNAAPYICEYIDDRVAVISQSGMARLYSGMFAHGELTALDTGTAEENVYVLGDKIVIFIIKKQGVRLDWVSAEKEKDGSMTVYYQVGKNGADICRANVNLTKTGGWAAGYSINSIALTY
ncbi:MAG: hypothetical protein GX254_09190 [Clostridiales bacterium]|jgi:hypothetical protein|nr:hypothetical protein [Clostridiales bacterium]